MIAKYERVRVDSFPGVAWTLMDTVLTYYGDDATPGEYYKCVMVGDDKPFIFPVDEVTQLEDHAYCGSCGQINCAWD